MNEKAWRPLCINYLAYLNPLQANGGGEMVLRGLIRTGRERGHSIYISAVKPEFQMNLQANADLYILADIHNKPRSRLPFRVPTFPKNVLKHVITNERYIHIDNAYVDVCDLPYLPCNGVVEGEECPYKTHFLRRLAGKTKCFRLSTITMYRNALLNVFVSPLHRKVVQKLVGEDVIGDFYELKPVVSAGIFFNRHMERDIENLYVGVICEAKGYYELKRKFPQGNIVLIGRRHRAIKEKDFGIQLGHMPPDQVALYMNRARNFVFLPRWPEPQGRVVVEAALCGCNLITNDNVGAMSWPFQLADPSSYAYAAHEFWEVVERKVYAAQGEK